MQEAVAYITESSDHNQAVVRNMFVIRLTGGRVVVGWLGH